MNDDMMNYESFREKERGQEQAPGRAVRNTMRIWDLEPERLCRSHLLGEHRELHAIWNILTKNKRGYACHPEVVRWRGRLKALYLRHEDLVSEMCRRGYCHHSPLDSRLARGNAVQEVSIDTPADQIRRLMRKGCGCDV